MSVNPAWEKFHLSILTMAQGEDSPRERVIRAMQYNLVYVNPKDIHDEVMRGDFKKIMRDIEKNGLNDYIYTLPDIEMGELIEKVLSIYDSIARKME